MSALHRRVAALEVGRSSTPGGTHDCSRLSVSELLFMIGICDQRIAGQAISRADLAIADRLNASVTGRPARMDAATAARAEEEFARMERLGWIDRERALAEVRSAAQATKGPEIQSPSVSPNSYPTAETT